jgi:hypothetical protein
LPLVALVIRKSRAGPGGAGAVKPAPHRAARQMARAALAAVAAVARAEQRPGLAAITERPHRAEPARRRAVVALVAAQVAALVVRVMAAQAATVLNTHKPLIVPQLEQVAVAPVARAGTGAAIRPAIQATAVMDQQPEPQAIMALAVAAEVEVVAQAVPLAAMGAMAVQARPGKSALSL